MLKLKTKKILAKEILIAFIVILITIFSYLFTFLNNEYFSMKRNKYFTELSGIQYKADSLSSSYNSKINKHIIFFGQISSIFRVNQYDTYEKVWERFNDMIKNDSLNIKWKEWNGETKRKLKDLDYSSPYDIKNYILSAQITELDIKQLNLSRPYYEQVNTLREKINNTNGINDENKSLIHLYSLIISASILFGLRYLFYTIVWSLKILNQKDEVSL